MEFLIALLVLAATVVVSLGIIYIVVRFALLDRYLEWLERVEERGKRARKRKAERKKA